MKSPFLLFAALVLFAVQASAFSVTFRLNMNGYGGFNVPEVNGTFNNWCGNCNPMSDANGDDIWEATINLGAGNYEYKFSFDSWAGQENLSATTGCTVTAGNFTNRTLQVQSDVVLPVVCWGLCSACLAPNSGEWQLVWSDEFDGNALNTAIWTPQIGNGGWGNNELQYYTANSTNLSVANGALHIAAIEENLGGSNYTSARIITNNTYEFQYGKIEARIKVPVGQGIWPAFWMLGANYESVGWPQCGEIDIMEHVNNERLTNGTVHWFDGNGHRYEGSSAPMTLNDYHVYGAIWNSNSVQFSIDGQVYYEYVYSIYNNATPIFQQPFFFLLNVAVGGNWPGSPDGSTIFPATMDVDWVRVYQDNPISVGETERNGLMVFPNPGKDKFQVMDVKAGDTYTVRSMDGNVIQKGKCSNAPFSIDAASWAAGLYLLEWNATDKHYHQLLVKE